MMCAHTVVAHVTTKSPMMIAIIDWLRVYETYGAGVQPYNCFILCSLITLQHACMGQTLFIVLQNLVHVWTVPLAHV